MKLLTAIVRPSVVEDAHIALSELGLVGMTVTEANGYGRQKGYTEVYRGTSHQVNFREKCRLEVLMDDDVVEPAVDALVRAVRTGEIGDGKIWLTPVETVVRVRTGERDSDAL